MSDFVVGFEQCLGPSSKLSEGRWRQKAGGAGSQLEGGSIAGIRVRRAVAADQAFVVALARRFAETRPPWRTEEEVTQGTADQLRRAFAERGADAAIFVAQTDSECLGFAYVVVQQDFFTREPHGHLSELAVVRDGVGAAAPLMEAVQNYVRERGLRFLTLNVNEGNERGRRFYERFGFEAQLRQYVKLL